jgi:molybdopterin converting factor small subunit
MVVIRGLNDDEVEAMAARFRGPHTILRFIEYMDVGTLNRWRRADVVPSAEILSRLRQAGLTCCPWPPTHRGETAKRYRYADGSGEIGFISSVTEPFCGDCNRLRVTADGTVHTCLFSSAVPTCVLTLTRAMASACGSSFLPCGDSGAISTPSNAPASPHATNWKCFPWGDDENPDPILRHARGKTRPDRRMADRGNADLAALYDGLARQHGFPLPHTSIRPAVNDAFRAWDYPLRDGDRVVFVPPVSGG